MTQPTLFDLPPAQAHSPTSVAAAEAVAPKVGRLRRVVLDCLRGEPGGLTDEEVIDRTGLSPSTARPRRIELQRTGLVKDSGRTRKTRSGRLATVWEAVA